MWSVCGCAPARTGELMMLCRPPSGLGRYPLVGWEREGCAPPHSPSLSWTLGARGTNPYSHFEKLTCLYVFYTCVADAFEREFGLVQVKFNIIQFVYPELQNLYQWLEVEFHPLKLASRVQSSLDFIAKKDDLAPYIPALHDITIMRVIKQVIHVQQLHADCK